MSKKAQLSPSRGRVSGPCPCMPDVVPEGTRGVATVDHFEVDDLHSALSMFQGEQVMPGRYARLTVDGVLTMTDTAMERRTNIVVIHRAHGDVLIAGLGLGMILHPILAHSAVKSVTVIEQSQDVIDLIAPTLLRHEQVAKLTLVCDDIFKWQPEKGRKWDIIYFDIWAYIQTENLKEMATLHRRFGRRLAEGGWMSSWNRDALLEQRRKGPKAFRRGWF